MVRAQEVSGNRISHIVRQWMLVLALFLSACDTVPIFVPELKQRAEKQPSILADITANTGVFIAPVQGLSGDLGEEIAGAVAKALIEYDIPALTESSLAGGHLLQGRGRPQGEALLIDWLLTAPDGLVVARFPGRLQAGAAAGAGREVKQMATRTAAAVAPHLRTVGGPASPVSRIAVLDIPDAPGDGETALRHALRRALGGSGVVLAEPSEPGVVRVAGRVELTDVSPTQQLVWLSWRVLDPSGGEIGVVDQRNPVPAGALDTQWGDIAYMAADGAKDGILDLLETYRQASARKPDQ